MASAEGWPPPKEEAISSREAAKVVRPWASRRSRSGCAAARKALGGDEDVVGLVLCGSQAGRGLGEEDAGGEKGLL